jgi:hypothetical protein
MLQTQKNYALFAEGERDKSTDVLPVVSPSISPKKANLRPIRDQLTDHQRQFAVEIYRGIDTDYSGQISATELLDVITAEEGEEQEEHNLAIAGDTATQKGAAVLEAGFQKAVQDTIDKMDPAKYKQGFEKYKDERGFWMSTPVQVSLVDALADNFVDLMEWLRYLRKAKVEKVQAAEAYYDFMTETQAIAAADASIDYWLEEMANKVALNKERRRAEFQKQEQALQEALRTPKVQSPALGAVATTKPDELSDDQKTKSGKLFKMFDFNKSASLDPVEILGLFSTDARAAEMLKLIDTNSDFSVGIDEWHRFLKKYKRETYDAALLEDSTNEAGAATKADELLAALFEEMKAGFHSEKSKLMRAEVRKRDEWMDADARAHANPLGGLELKKSDAVKKREAQLHTLKTSTVNARYTPDKKLVYHARTEKEFSERGSDFYGSVANWYHNASRNYADTEAEASEANVLQIRGVTERDQCRAAAHKVYNNTTMMLKERVKDSRNANDKIDKALKGTEGYLRNLEEARGSVAAMFELDAEALEEIQFCKEKRSSRPVSERIKDQVSLALKRRTEELDIESHEAMLKQIDETQEALLRAREFLTQHLGSKMVAADIDDEAACMLPGVDPAQPEEEVVPAKKKAEPSKTNVWVKPKKWPKSQTSKFATFQKYAKAYPLRGTGLPHAPTFAEIRENNSFVDQTEFARFVLDYGFEQMLDQNQIAEIFQRNARKEDGQAGSLGFEEFVEVVEEVKRAHEGEKKDWGNTAPEPQPFRPARKTALTMKEVVLVKEHKPPMQQRLHDKVYIPIHQPIMWKKEVRDICDSVKGHQAEADRVFRKAYKFVHKRRYDDHMGRKDIIAALRTKMNATADIIDKLKSQKDHAVEQHQKDMTEKEEVEQRIGAIEEYLSVAISRLQHRCRRPDSERGRDPAEWALDEEIRELRWELQQLASTHKKLEANLDKLEKLILQLDRDITDKSTARNLDEECLTKIKAKVEILEKGDEKELLDTYKAEITMSTTGIMNTKGTPILKGDPTVPSSSADDS